MAESWRVQQLLLWISLQIWERQEHGEASLTDDRNCKGQPIALTQSGLCGPTCIFLITSRDLPEMKEEPFTVLSNRLTPFALRLCCLINIIKAEVVMGAFDIIIVGNHIPNISIYNLQ